MENNKQEDQSQKKIQMNIKKSNIQKIGFLVSNFKYPSFVGLENLFYIEQDAQNFQYYLQMNDFQTKVLYNATKFAFTQIENQIKNYARNEYSQDSFEIKKWIDQPDQESQNQAKSSQNQIFQLDNDIEYFINEDELERVIRYNEGSYQQQIQLRDQLKDLIKSPSSSQQLKGTAQCWLAWYHLLPLADYKENEKQAVKIFNEYQDCPFGQFCMAMTYLQGYAEQEKNPEMTWFYAQKSSSNGDRRGIGLVGYLYHTSFGVENNMFNAIIYYERAADLGNANAMYNLGICFYNGDGVNQNKEKAIEYYKIAAKKQYQGAVEALQELGIDIKQELELEIEKQVQEEKLLEFQEENKLQNEKLLEKKNVQNNQNNMQEKGKENKQIQKGLNQNFNQQSRLKQQNQIVRKNKKYNTQILNVHRQQNTGNVQNKKN